MFEDLDDITTIDTKAYKEVEASTNKYSSSSNNDYSKFKKKEEVVEEPYVPIAIYVDRDFPPEIKQRFYTYISKLVAKNITVRVNADDKEFFEKVASLSDKYIEAYIPWKKFNEIESKFYYNTLTARHVAYTNFSGWEKIPDSVKALLARNVRMIFGEKNNSVCLCLLTWSKDGASKLAEVNKDTGRASFVIKVAAKHSIPVLNIGKETAGNVLERTFNL